MPPGKKKEEEEEEVLDIEEGEGVNQMWGKNIG